MQFTKAIQYDRATKDFAVLINNELIGYAATYTAGEALANAHVYELLARQPIASQGAAAGPATITRQAVAAVVVEARRQLADDRRWCNALNKAYGELELGGWQFDGQMLRISSRTSTRRRYQVTASACECQASAKGQPCWHRAAHRLLVKASAAQIGGQA